MKQQINLTGIVLSTSLVGEYDKRLVILTKERGKITAFARGARRPGNALMAIAAPFNYGVFHCYRGYDAYYVTSVEAVEYFEELKKDLDGVCYATYFCEMADYFTLEGTSDKHLLNLLYVSFRTLVKQQMSYALIRRTFEIKLFALEGIGMQTFACVKCQGEVHAPCIFDSESGGILCEKCRRHAGRPIMISQSALYTLMHIQSTGLERLFGFRVSDAVQLELDVICNSYMAVHVDVKFKSLNMLDTL